MFIENHLSLTQEQENFVEFIKSNSFPWFYQRATDNYKFFGHAFMKRNYDPSYIGQGDINSDYYNLAKSIFDKFCTDNNVLYKTILRSSANCALPFAEEYSDIHVDHEFDHKVFLLYLNDVANGETCLFDNDKNLIKTIKPEKYKGVIFDGKINHAIRSCAINQIRLVLVFTFI